MRHCFKLFAASFLINLGATLCGALPATDCHSSLNNELGSNGTIPLERRSIGGNSLEEDTTFNLSFYLNEMQGFIHADYIDFASFSIRGEQIVQDVIYTQLWVPSKFRTEIWGNKLQYVRNLFDGITEASNLRGRFKGCNYWGSDLVEDMAALHVRVLSLGGIPDSSRGFEYYRKKADYKQRLAILSDRAKKDTEMTVGMRRLFERQADLVKTSYQRINEADDGKQVHVEALTCPAI